MELQLVVFGLADEAYGVDINTVESIIKLQEITKVPHVPDFVEGVTNLRGSVLPVIDLRMRFGLEEGAADDKEKRIVVVDASGSQVGMIVDSVSEVLTISDEDVKPPAAIMSTVDSAFITGIAKVGERLVILLDLSMVLTIEEKTELKALPA